MSEIFPVINNSALYYQLETNIYHINVWIVLITPESVEAIWRMLLYE